MKSNQIFYCFCISEFTSPELQRNTRNEKEAQLKAPAPGSISDKYQVFRDIDATVILDVEEERQLQLQRDSHSALETDEPDQEELPDIFKGINLQRGKTGVYEIEDLVKVLRLNNAENIFVCTVPREIKYVDYICVVSGMSFRHMRGVAEFVRKVFKMKRNAGDIIPKIEGENSRDWMAMDLGNIALHIFAESARQQYDLESLWAIGAKYDHECNKPNEPLVDLFERHSIYLKDLKPLNDNANFKNSLA
ncbi:uncharacterized protein LOC129770168 isoform X2 [Toxorhynchites rutilus septentrionalis]|uniref:uncharacterized protein LOC129770168 isoform X2 n=1 Tax=Toxorhynchites rutilus septentrionalis TaxID=329112 RepID=UPI00247881CE|nr:uncharacterized protein LOC129770168 isoform X2 [Toxorhynchites rutilus septentrionalis]